MCPQTLFICLSVWWCCKLNFRGLPAIFSHYPYMLGNVTIVILQIKICFHSKTSCWVAGWPSGWLVCTAVKRPNHLLKKCVKEPTVTVYNTSILLHYRYWDPLFKLKLYYHNVKWLNYRSRGLLSAIYTLSIKSKGNHYAAEWLLSLLHYYISYCNITMIIIINNVC